MITRQQTLTTPPGVKTSVFKRIKIFFFSSLFLFSALYHVQAQTRTIDSLSRLVDRSGEDTNQVILLTRLSNEFTNNSLTESAISTGRKAIALSRRLQWKKGFAMSCRSIANIYINISDFPKAQDYLYKSLEAYESINDRSGIASVYNNLGLISYYEKDMPKATEFYEKSLKIKKELKDRKGIANTLTNLGSVYSERKNYAKGLELLFEALKIKKEIKNIRGTCSSYCIIGEVLNEMAAEPDSLMKRDLYILKNLWNFKADQLDKNKIVKTLLDSAKNFFEISLDIAAQLDDKVQKGYCYRGLGDVFRLKKEFKPAIKNYLFAAAESDSAESKLQYAAVAKLLHQCYSDIGAYKDAYYWLLKYKNMSDSLNSEDNKKAFLKRALEYDFEKQKALAQKEHEKEIEISVQKEEKQRAITYYSIAGLFLLMVFTIIIVGRLRITRKQNTIIETQKKLVEEKQVELLESIAYAKHLQDAILPPEDFVEAHCPDNFIMYKPKDIVAGDFYWAERTGDYFFIAAADSTGHGVPGAMVSVVCSNALNRTVKEFGLTGTGEILNKTKELVVETFEKSSREVKDGMDISLLRIDLKSREVEWSGANIPLYYVCFNSSTNTFVLNKINPNKYPIGKSDISTSFTSHRITCTEKTTFYLFSDGYADQFGGVGIVETKIGGKKFMHKRFMEALLKGSEKNMKEQKTNLLNSFEKWKGELDQVDDVLVIGVRV